MHGLLNALIVAVFVIVRRCSRRHIDEGRRPVPPIAAWPPAQNAVLAWRCRELPRRVSVQA